MSDFIKINDKEYPVKDLQIGIDYGEEPDRSATYFLDRAAKQMLSVKFDVNVGVAMNAFRHFRYLLASKKTRSLRNKRGSFSIREAGRWMRAH